MLWGFYIQVALILHPSLFYWWLARVSAFIPLLSGLAATAIYTAQSHTSLNRAADFTGHAAAYISLLPFICLIDILSHTIGAPSPPTIIQTRCRWHGHFAARATFHLSLIYIFKMRIARLILATRPPRRQLDNDSLLSTRSLHFQMIKALYMDSLGYFWRRALFMRWPFFLLSLLSFLLCRFELSFISGAAKMRERERDIIYPHIRSRYEYLRPSSSPGLSS